MNKNYLQRSLLFKYILGVALFFCCIPNLVAQQKDSLNPNKENNLPEVLIRSTPIIDTLQRIPASVNVVSAADLQRGDQLSLANEINKNPGIQMQQGALNLSRISIRGLGARSQYSTNRVKAYIEGIPLTTGEGETTLEDIDLNLIERIEIIKGPASSTYGAGLGGVMNISIIKPQQESTSIQLNGLVGSFGTFKSGVTAALASGNASALFSYNHLESDGFRDNSTYDRDTFTAYAKTQLAPAHSLAFFGNFTKLKAFIPSSINLQDFNENPDKAAFTWGQAQGYESYDKAIAGLSHTWNFSDKSAWTTSIFGNYRDGYEPRPFDILDEESFAFGIRSNFNTAFTIGSIPVKSSLGLEYFDESYDVQLFENLYEDNNGNGTLQGNSFSEQHQDRKYLNLFAQFSLQFTERLKGEVGVSYNHSRYVLDDSLNNTGEDRSGKYTYPRQFLPQAGLTYEVVSDKFIYANVSKGFSLPSVAETLTPEGAINTTIEPEIGINYELGLKATWLNKKLYTELALYSIQVNDLIVADRIAEDQYVGRNIGKTDHNGIELLINYNQSIAPGWFLKPYGSLTLNDYSFDEFVDNDVNYNGNDLTGVPDQIYNLGIDLVQNSGFKFNINYRHTGMIPLNDGNTLYSDSYNLLNARADYSFQLLQQLDLTIYTGVNNLTDTDYAAQILPNATGFGGAAPRYYYPGDPVNYYVGLRLNYHL
ncbi:TonB-dependent receptor family protein [Flavimarina sp. Hel_I_48]|uniref:TonB-dependent receptor family protein n=1 Tax=Flavimarina sp. Hel_I_48 TaxID=1392488 RepID=UPI0006922BFE|nr:TonB-dependent receptor [Flavimarina sp. Hel_I_48]